MKELGQEGFIIRKFCFEYDLLRMPTYQLTTKPLLLNKIISVVRKKNKRLTEIKHFDWMSEAHLILFMFFLRQSIEAFITE